ncbi:hypothetical protein J3458_008791 [Metarhizium acridum]|uniref:Cell wall protein n=1 Tax=Metarhizium acridum (strain CQMa 102) TaxID=655827 RepID=E9DY08_METAQ|nr:uncharacterized protein MAC_02506 [Metarhizium acridum CQMa 102]EFY91343.1 hypothetical protein MAC_02506 [Metarhizium acridum CQMa 102]KAG8414891.1 hypothetical protein J3458_008791 [Metarhizium acridum]
MKFTYASLLCAVVSAAPIADVKRGMSGAAVDGLNKALKTTIDSVKNGLGGVGGVGGLGGLGGLGAAKRDEKPEARQAEHVTVRLDQPAADVSVGDVSGQVDKRQDGPSKLTALAQTVSHAVFGPKGVGLGGGVGLKRDGKQELSKRQLNIPKNVVSDVTSGKLMEDLHNLHIMG